jgi:chromosome segregation ATPase
MEDQMARFESELVELEHQSEEKATKIRSMDNELTHDRAEKRILERENTELTQARNTIKQ